MSLQTFFEPSHLLQTIVVALSIFNLVTFLWLAVTVWLNSDRRTSIARLGVVGLGFSALFFFIHAMLIFGPLRQEPGLVTPDFLWRLLWLPAICVPYIWFAIGLHYAALINEGWRQRRPLLLICSGFLGLFILVLLVLHQSTFTFVGTLRLLTYSDLFDDTSAGLFSSTVIVPALFLFYVTFCAIGPWFTPMRMTRVMRALWAYIRRGRMSQPTGADKSAMGAINRPLQALADSLVKTNDRVPRVSGSAKQPPLPNPLHRVLSNAFWDDPTDVELLEEPVLSWHLARPILFLAAILMVALTTTLGIMGIGSILDWFELKRHQGASLPVAHSLTAIPLNLLFLDMLANGAVALIILLVGYSVVRHGILIERPLARRGFFEQWRGIVIVATTVAIFIALLVTFTHSSLGSLLLITSLATGVYALFTWSSYTAHDRYIALLGPFLRSTNMRHWLNTDQQKTERGLEDLFFHLCQDALAVQCARLIVIAGSVRRTFSYRWPDVAGEQFLYAASELRPKFGQGISSMGARRGTLSPVRVQLTIDEQPMVCWVLPIYDELGLVAMLYLGPREDGGAFTDEDMDLAHACGQRILDTLGDHEAMQAVAGLLRRRIIDVKLLGAQQRRILHDDILPQMHLALLRLETLRSVIHSDSLPSLQEDAGGSPTGQVLDEAVELISDAHRRLAALMRATAPGAPHRLERDGLMNAICAMLQQDFQHAFDEVEWCVSEETARCIDEVTPPAIAELIFAAVQEALRNAARHARGTDVHRRLRLTLKASCGRPGSQPEPNLEVVVADDGVGIISASTSTTGTGGGLLTHSALLAIAGGTLTVKSAPGEGVSVRIVLPAESLR
jgi:signal transduction histidine kinase